PSLPEHCTVIGVSPLLRAVLLAVADRAPAHHDATPAGRLLGVLFDELAEKLHEELDYALEADNIEEFHRLFGNDDRFRIPQVHRELSTSRILTMDRIHGVPIGEFLGHASAEARAAAGRNLADLFFESAFRHRVLHADPHPGNFLFEPDGRIGLLDFGCVKRFDADWIATYARLVMAAVDGERQAILEETRALGAWVGDDPEAAEVIVDFCDAVMAPLRDGPYTIGPDDHMLERVKPVTERMWKFSEIRGPRHLLFLHRTLGGLYTMMRQLEVTEDWPTRMRSHLEAAAAR
ncbi:MAG: AarF/UbiB family protein, partial [Myxococcota bacterium]